jgi:hypothetical protein
MRKSFLISLTTIIALSTIFYLPTLFLPLEISSASDRCGTDYQDIALPKLVRIYRKSYVAAGFKVINQKNNGNNATLRVRFLKKGSKFHQDLEYRFDLDQSGKINACGSVYDSRELSEDGSNYSERYDYTKTFSNVDQKAMNQIKKEISAIK